MSEELASRWRQISGEIGAEYMRGSHEGSTHICLLRIRVDKWPIAVAGYEIDMTTPDLRWGYFGIKRYYETRLRAPYTRKDAFDFNLYRMVLPIKLLKFLRFAAVVDHPYIQLDSRVMVVGNDESKLRALFSNPKIYQLFQSVARKKEWKWLGVGPYKDLPTGVWALYCRTRRRFWPTPSTLLRGQRAPVVLDDVEYLKTLFEVFEETLNQLVVIGSASGEVPDVVLSHVPLQ